MTGRVDLTQLAPRFAQIAVDNVDEAIVLLVPSGSVLAIEYVNRGFQRIFGYAPEDVVGSPVSLLASRTDAPPDLLRMNLDALHPHRTEGMLRTKSGGNVLVEVEMQLVELGGVSAGLLVMRDVTEYRRLEHIAAASELAESVGQVFAGIRHELGNPLNSLKAALTLLADPTMALSLEKRADFLQRALGEIRRMESLLEHLRTFNRNELVHFDRVEVRPLLERFVRIAAEECVARGATIELTTNSDISMLADARLVHQILLLLLANALDAMDGTPTRRILLACFATTRAVEIRFSDTGVGMDADELRHALRPFVTTKPKGTGLGLALAQRYSALTRCALELTSEPGVGTCCTLTFQREASTHDLD
ncbi:MAG: ATP-binding protein [Polyangiaceae bacterium]